MTGISKRFRDFLQMLNFYKAARDGALRPHLKSKAALSKSLVIIDIIDKHVKKNLRIYNTDENAWLKIKMFFVSQKYVLYRHDLV